MQDYYMAPLLSKSDCSVTTLRSGSRPEGPMVPVIRIFGPTAALHVHVPVRFIAYVLVAAVTRVSPRFQTVVAATASGSVYMS